jgi:hypothetical protein
MQFCAAFSDIQIIRRTWHSMSALPQNLDVTNGRGYITAARQGLRLAAEDDRQSCGGRYVRLLVLSILLYEQLF